MEKRLRELRQEKNMTQAQLAETINVARQAISSWERGETKPSSDNLVQLSQVYGVSVDYLLGKEETKTIPPAEKPQEEKKTPSGACRRLLYIGIVVVMAAALLLISVLFFQLRAKTAQRGEPIPMEDLSVDTLGVTGTGFHFKDR